MCLHVSIYLGCILEGYIFDLENAILTCGSGIGFGRAPGKPKMTSKHTFWQFSFQFSTYLCTYTSTGTSWVCWISTGCSCWDWKHIENVIYGCEYPAAGLVFICFSKLMPLILRPRDTKQQTWNQPTVRPENVFLFKRFSNAYNSWRTVSFSYQTHFILCICPFKWLYL